MSKKPKLLTTPNNTNNTNDYVIYTPILKSIIKPIPLLVNMKSYHRFFSFFSHLSEQFDFIERDFDSLPFVFPKEDLIIDETSCLMQVFFFLFFYLSKRFLNSFHPLALLSELNPISSETNVLKSLLALDSLFVQRLIYLSLKYQYVYILLENEILDLQASQLLLKRKTLQPYPFTPPIQTGLSHLLLLIHSLKTIFNTQISFYMTENNQQKAWWLQKIIQLCETRVSNQFNDTMNSAYPSLTIYNSKKGLSRSSCPQEVFLSSFPVINNYQAQLLLSQSNLKQLLSITQQEWEDRFSLWIPERSRKLLFQFIHQTLQNK